MSLNRLTKRYTDECQRRKLPIVDAQELHTRLLGALRGEADDDFDALSRDELKDACAWVERFIKLWDRVQGEERVIHRLCTAALKHGYDVVFVNDGEERHDITSETPLSEIVELATAVDESAITIRSRSEGHILSFYLVFGNSPEELIADHTAHPDAETIYNKAWAGA